MGNGAEKGVIGNGRMRQNLEVGKRASEFCGEADEIVLAKRDDLYGVGIFKVGGI